MQAAVMGDHPDVSPGDEALVAVRERISLTCPFTQSRIVQAARMADCTHASAFCALQAPPCCPWCGAAAAVVIDAPLTLFLSTHQNAATCQVRRASGAFVYSRPQAERRRRPSHSVQTARPSKQLRAAIDVDQPATRSLEPALEARARKPPPRPATRSESDRKMARAARAHSGALARSLEQTRTALIQRALRDDSSSADILWGTPNVS